MIKFLTISMFVDELQNYFSKYGNLVECNLKKDPFTGFSRGFAFITFDDPAAVDLVGFMINCNYF